MSSGLLGCDTSPPASSKPAASSASGTTPATGSTSTEPAQTVARAAEDDRSAPELLKEKSAEARKWLADAQKHILVKVSREKLVPFVNDLYAAGAPAVHAVDLHKTDDKEITALFVVELPKEKAARAKVIQVHNEFWKQRMDDPNEAEEEFAADHGQRYIVLNFD
jgi:peptidyl-tRNA hydrolase